MKRLTVVLLMCMMFLVSACGDSKVIPTEKNGNVRYGTYGLLTENTDKNPDIEYKIIVGNVVWSIILIESIVFPVYFIGFSMYEPVGVKDGIRIKGKVLY